MRHFATFFAFAIALSASTGALRADSMRGASAENPQHPAGQAVTRAPIRRALLIGINDYAHVPRLRGCVNDVHLVENLLRTQHGFGDVRKLCDGAATREGILDALRQLFKDAGPEDVVHIHYSGHGAQVKDLSGDEDDGYDETLVPQDGRDPDQQIPDILDDELAALFETCRCPGQLTIVLDACHSGSALRSLESRVRGRGLPTDDSRIELYRRPGDGVRSRDVTQSTLVFPVITSARADQEALDGPVDGTDHGLFTAAWVRAMASGGTSTGAGSGSSAGSSARSMLEVHRRTGAEYAAIVERLRVRHKASTPVLEALPARRREPFFPALLAGKTQPAHRPTLTALRADAAGTTFRLKNGTRAGAGVGTAWSIHAGSRAAVRPDSAIAVGTIVRHDDADAVLRVDTRAVGSAAELAGSKTPLLAVNLAPPASPTRVPTSLSLSRTATDRRGAIQAELSRHLPSIDWVERHGEFSIHTHRGDHRIFGDDTAQPLATVRAPGDNLRNTAAVIARSLAQTDLMALENHSSALDLRIWHDRNPGLETVASHQDDRQDDHRTRSRQIEIVAATGAHRTAYRVHQDGAPYDDSNCFLLNVEASRRGYLTVVNLDARGAVSVLFPNSLSEDAGYFPDGEIPGGEAIRIPDATTTDNRAGFLLAYRASGTEVVRAFLSEDLATATAIRDAFQEIEERSQGLDAAATDSDAGLETAQLQREVLGDLRDFLLTAVMRRSAATRGIEVVSNRPRQHVSTSSDTPSGQSVEASFADADPALAGDWTAATVRVEVR